MVHIEYNKEKSCYFAENYEQFCVEINHFLSYDTEFLNSLPKNLVISNYFTDIDWAIIMPKNYPISFYVKSVDYEKRSINYIEVKIEEKNEEIIETKYDPKKFKLLGYDSFYVENVKQFNIAMHNFLRMNIEFLNSLPKKLIISNYFTDIDWRIIMPENYPISFYVKSVDYKKRSINYIEVKIEEKNEEIIETKYDPKKFKLLGYDSFYVENIEQFNIAMHNFLRMNIEFNSYLNSVEINLLSRIKNYYTDINWLSNKPSIYPTYVVIKYILINDFYINIEYYDEIEDFEKNELDKSKPIKRQCFLFTIPIYGGNVILYSGRYHDNLLENFPDLNEKYLLSGGTSVRVNYDEEHCFLIGISNHTHKTLAHEIFHCAVSILDYAGINFVDESEEAYSYLVGYLTMKIYQIIEENNIKIITEKNDDKYQIINIDNND